ncbi:hypothetical protein [Nocardia rhizosphaerihabitans]|uniref:Uncharacterized protein n=1 Tax=Nocardia rhizosphaerihabitans TaxID=1691570 RepID=A0ABQ2KBJ3_9NOCA|nr:hypothetical protein [Nocardia rhizosphaerihabitans]GGN78604.1 hypothetical protein GCM10011610_26330 [Nocardia rhizosphaerihabitans]
MSQATTLDPGAGAVTVVGRRTPMVLSVARCLREGLARGVTAAPGNEARTVCLASTTDSQRAHVTLSGSDLLVTADAPAEAEITWNVRWSNPVPTEDGPDGFAKDVQQLLAGRDVDWRSAAEGFWKRVNAAPGIPAGLGVVCADDGTAIGLGDAQPDGHTVLGTSAALARFFEGRSTLVEELEGGEFAIDVSFPVFSALFGANLKVVCGEL